MANLMTSKRDEIMSTAINFVPTCGNCHKVIFGAVGMTHDNMIELYDDNKDRYAVISERTITPYSCPYCHTIFKSITAPRLDAICHGEPYISYPQGYPME